MVSPLLEPFREAYLNEQLQIRFTEEQLKYRQQFEKLKIGFELETIRFEKVLKEKAQDIIKGLKIRQFDRLIDIGSRLRMIQTSHSKSKPESGCSMVQNEIVELAEHVEKLLSELSNDNEYSASKSEVFFFTSNDELQKKMGQTPFNPRLKEEIQKI